MKPIIELKDVWKIYNLDQVKVNALQGLNLKVKPKEFLAIMGKSGSGKSTAMGLIGCLDLPTKGEVYLDQQNIAKLSESDLAQIRGRKIGFIFQTFNLIPSLSALENVTLPMVFQGKNKEQRLKIAKDLLCKVGLEDRYNHHPGKLSGGERQRVAIARSLVNDPEVILADEPTGNLDTKTGIQIMNLIQKLHKNGKTIILVTHDLNIAKRAQRIATLSDGVIIKEQGVRI